MPYPLGTKPFGILLILNVLPYFIKNIFNIILYPTFKNPIKVMRAIYNVKLNTSESENTRSAFTEIV